jgi:hypothetical protein
MKMTNHRQKGRTMPFIREKSDDISGDSQQVVQEAASFDRSKLPDGIFRSGTFPVGTCAVEPVGKGTVQQFPPPVVTMPQTDRHSKISPDVAVEGVYMNQRKDPSDIILQGTFFQQGNIQQGTTDGIFPRHFSDYLMRAGAFPDGTSTRHYGRHFSPRHFFDCLADGGNFSTRHCSTRQYGRFFSPRHFSDQLTERKNFSARYYRKTISTRSLSGRRTYKQDVPSSTGVSALYSTKI